MKLVAFARSRQWGTLVGYLLYVVSLTAGYYYTLTFVQLGLTDLGTRRIGLSPTTVSVVMAGFALLTMGAAVTTGVAMDRRGWGGDLYAKFRLLFVALSGQLALTAAASSVNTGVRFGVWIIVCSLTLGIAIPVAFSLMVDLVPVSDRGYVAAVVAGGSFFFAATVPLEWRIEAFTDTATAVLVPAVFVFGLLSVTRFKIVDTLATQHERPSFGVGRFCRPTPVRTMSIAFWGPVALLFGAFFVDSLGFLRIIEEPVYVATSWQSTDVTVRLLIAVAHVVSALGAGYLYTNAGRNTVFAGVFGLFVAAHLLYSLDSRLGLDVIPSLVLPLLYVFAVSFYTTLTFALWPDLSTTETIGTHTGIGVGVAGWGATFLATAVALSSAGAGVPFETHMIYVNGVSALLLGAVAVSFVARRRSAHSGSAPE